MTMGSTLFATMNDGDVTAVASKAIWVTLQLGAPVLIVALVVGLVVSVFQAVTQIQEQTLVFIPKIIAIVAVLAITGPWMMSVMTDYTQDLFREIPALVAGH
ncbi:MAG: EscS/YscS/HrcS family type secretion system export apparatus protein [Thermoleophilia bacterium]|nr:EscS/YscS/HrcS family type secretion system export apparatus protein [Thermoleophilia bacterium]